MEQLDPLPCKLNGHRVIAFTLVNAQGMDVTCSCAGQFYLTDNPSLFEQRLSTIGKGDNEASANQQTLHYPAVFCSRLVLANVDGTFQGVGYRSSNK